MNKPKRLGLTGILLAGSLALAVSGCSKIELPSHSKISVYYYGSDLNGYPVFSPGWNWNSDIEEKSRITGEISYIGPYNGFVKDDSACNDKEIVIRIKTSERDYLLLSERDNIPSSMVLEKFKKGDKVSIPTITQDDNLPSVKYERVPRFRFLNDIDRIPFGKIRGVK